MYIMRLVVLFFMVIPLSYASTSIEKIDDETYYLHGTITDETRKYIETNIDKIKYLWLNSTGGEAESSFYIAKIIEDHDVYVIVYNYCASGCTVIWFGANKDKRFIQKGSMLFLHNTSANTNKLRIIMTNEQYNKWNEQLARTSSLLTALYIKAGIPIAHVLDAMNQFGNDGLEVGEFELLKWGIIKETQIIPEQEETK